MSVFALHRHRAQPLAHPHCAGSAGHISLGRLPDLQQMHGSTAETIKSREHSS